MAGGDSPRGRPSGPPPEPAGTVLPVLIDGSSGAAAARGPGTEGSGGWPGASRAGVGSRTLPLELAEAVPIAALGAGGLAGGAPAPGRVFGPSVRSEAPLVSLAGAATAAVASSLRPTSAAGSSGGSAWGAAASIDPTSASSGARRGSEDSVRTSTGAGTALRWGSSERMRAGLGTVGDAPLGALPGGLDGEGRAPARLGRAEPFNMRRFLGGSAMMMGTSAVSACRGGGGE